VVKETLSLCDGTSLEVTKQPGVDDATWEETKMWVANNPEEARKMETYFKDSKQVRDWMQTNTLSEYYDTKVGSGDEMVSMKLLGLEGNPEFAHIFEDIKKGGVQSAMQFYYNEPMMLKISRAMGGIPEEVKSSLNEIHRNPVTPQEACKMGNMAAVETYLAADGADIEAKDAKGVTCLGYAIGANRTAIVKLLIEKKANPSEVDSSGGSGLHYAAAYGRKDLLEYLAKSGGDINKKNNAGQTPLALATKNKQAAAIDFLKSKGAKI